MPLAGRPPDEIGRWSNNNGVQNSNKGKNAYDQQACRSRYFSRQKSAASSKYTRRAGLCSMTVSTVDSGNKDKHRRREQQHHCSCSMCSTAHTTPALAWNSLLIEVTQPGQDKFPRAKEKAQARPNNRVMRLLRA